MSITRYEVTGAPPPPVEGKDKFRIVLVLANPIGTADLDLGADERAVVAAINDLQKKTQAVKPVWWRRPPKKN